MRPNLNSDDKAKALLGILNPFTSSKTSVFTTENPTVSAPLYGQSDPNLELQTEHSSLMVLVRALKGRCVTSWYLNVISVKYRIVLHLFSFVAYFIRDPFTIKCPTNLSNMSEASHFFCFYFQHGSHRVAFINTLNYRLLSGSVPS